MMIGTYEKEKIVIKKIFYIDDNFIKVKVNFGEEIISRKKTADEILVDKKYLIGEYEKIEFNYFKNDIYYKEKFHNGENIYYEEKKVGENFLMNDFPTVYAIYYDDDVVSVYTDINDIFLFIRNVLKIDYEVYHIYSYPTIESKTEYILIKADEVIAKYDEIQYATNYSKVLSEFELEAVVTKVTKQHLYLPFIKDRENIDVNKLF